MSHRLFVAWAGASLAAVAVGDEGKLARWHEAFAKEVRPVLEAKCLSCHSGAKPEGDFDLSPAATAERPIDHAGIWDRVAARVRLNEMPPAGSPGLSDPEKGALHRWFDSRPGRDLCDELATDETKSWYRGRVMSRRITNAEYDRMVEALSGVDLDPARNFPADGAGGEGFDTTGDTLFTSPIHLERYLAAAEEVVEAVVTEEPPPEASPLATGWNRWVGADFEPTAARVRDRVATFATAAWRRPIRPDELDRLMALATAAAGAEAARPLDGLREPLKAVLVSPNFLFLVENSPAGTGVHPLTGHQLAARLAVFLWSSLPDDELLRLADAGTLHDETVLRAQVRRMLRDPKSRGLAEDFGLQWLELKNFSQRVAPDRETFPEFDAPLAADFREEVVRVVHRVFAEDRSLLELVDAPVTPLNGRLAAHYGLPWTSAASEPPADAAAGDRWRLVSLPDRRRGGVLTTAAVLAGTSYPKRTSPVLRGQWVLGQVLGGKVPPPPPGVPPLEEKHDEAGPKTLRQRLEAHRTNPSCASCHDRMDPIGFGLENYDVLGRWRSEDAGQPVDATGSLPPGGGFNGPEELKQRLLDRRGEFIKHLTRKLLGYALGRELDEFDQCVVDRTAKKLGESDHRSALLVEEIVVGHPFRHRYHKMEAEPARP
jgi:mono/diheme cytochrome c family protein